MHSFVAFIGLYVLGYALWSLVLALRYRRWIERRVRVVGFNAAGWTATVEPETPGPLLEVPWPYRSRRQPLPGIWHTLIHPPGQPERVRPGQGWRRSVGDAWKCLLIGTALMAASKGMLALGLT